MSTMNRIHNCTNPHQGSQQRVLCVCSAGLLRSPTLAHVLAGKGFNTRAAGIVEDYALVPVDEVLLHWADKIICVSPEVEVELLKKFPGAHNDSRVVSLNIPDVYAYMAPPLVEHIEEVVKELIDTGVLDNG